MKAVKVTIAVLSLVLVLIVALWESKEWISPGELHPSHQDVSQLSGVSDCVTCHGEAQTSMEEACLACHQDIHDQIASHKGLHGSLEAGALSACEACHREHTNGAVALVGDQSFQAAGVPDPERYDHRDIPGFNLVGRHAELHCEHCHRHARAERLEPGQKRFLGQSSICTSCHEDVHKGALGSDCASCHGQSRPFETAAEFTHPPSFPLAGGHAGRSCAACHLDNVFTGLSVDCVSCHQKEFDAATDPNHAAAGFLKDCRTCHDTATWKGVAFEHPAFFPLVGGHGGLLCQTCHEAGGEHSVAELMGGPSEARQCAACHRSPHRESLVAAAEAVVPSEAGKDACAVCHDPAHQTFLRPAANMPAELHRATGFALDPPHDGLACEHCHQQQGNRQRLPDTEELAAQFAAFYPGRAQEDCQACHEDPHLGQFNQGATQGRCTACHQQTQFVPSDFDLEHHTHTRFPLTGAHEAVACNMCHVMEGQARRFVPTATQCAACHEDVHHGIFDSPDKPAVVDDQTGCARCHSTSSFTELRVPFEDHGTWTGYPLTGAHAETSCNDCHRPTNEPDADGRLFGRADRSCQSCHIDVHAGQFVIEGVTDCTRCHKDTSRFSHIDFDHQKDSRFVLDEHHSTLDCVSCHQPVETATGVPVVRYRPMGTRCQDCHKLKSEGDDQ